MYLVFDLDDTLLDTTKVTAPFLLSKVIEAWAKRGHLRISPTKAMEELQHSKSLYGTGRECLAEFVRGEHLSAEALEMALEIYYGYWDEQIPIALKPGALELLDSMSHCAKALVTMGETSRQRDKIHRCGIEKYFERILIVEEPIKSKAYDELSRTWIAEGAAPTQIVVIGDRPETDLLPAHQRGWRTVCMGHGAEPSGWDPTIRDIEELFLILQAWECAPLWEAATNSPLE